MTAGTSSYQLPHQRYGVYTALITPFRYGAIDFVALEKLIDRQVRANVQSITLMGTTGEGATLSLEERRALLHAARKHIPSSILFFSGCGSSSTQETIQQAKIAEEEGCDGIQVVTPSYNKPTQEGLLQHFQAIHNATSLEIFLYNIPGRTAVNIEMDTLKRLFGLERVRGMKEASGSLSVLMDVIDLAKDFEEKITILTGDDLLTLPAIALGAHGVMSVISNILPKSTNRLVQACLSGDKQEAFRLHYMMRPIMQACFYETNPAPVKYILSQSGYTYNELRLPLVPVSSSSERKIDIAMNLDSSKPLLHEDQITYSEAKAEAQSAPVFVSV